MAYLNPPQTSASNSGQKVTPSSLLRDKGNRAITMLTAYDYPSARAADLAQVDILLVGDSLGTVLYGHDSTIKVELEDIVRHSAAVRRGTQRALVLADLPFLTYQVDEKSALLNAGRCLKDGNAEAVKLEGGSEMASTVEFLVKRGIPVCGHIGLQPQSFHIEGRYRKFGKSESEAKALRQAAKDLQSAGAFALVLECVQPELAGLITSELAIPTIGIGSGPRCDGQVLVFHDLLGLNPSHVPSFVRPTANLWEPLVQGIRDFVHRTQSEFPETRDSLGTSSSAELKPGARP